MSLKQKIEKLAESSRFDVVCGKNWELPIYQSKGQNQDIPLLKLLISNKCIFDCKYCNNRCKNKETSISPSKIAKLSYKLFKEGKICGLFLSSGIYSDPENVMEDLIRTAKLSREKGFKGYIHLKVMPGCSKDQIERASEIADRLSINMESPTKSHLSELCSVKDMKIDVERRLRWIKEQEISKSTQFVVGALEETDSELLDKTNELYSKYDLQRIYYSGFKPLKNTPLEEKESVDKNRVGRLYQSDWLLRVYNYPLNELISITENGMLPNKDPKLEIAKNKEKIVINQSGIEELMKIPGVGPKKAKKINKRKEEITEISQLKKLGVPEKAMPFIKINGDTQKKITEY